MPCSGQITIPSPDGIRIQDNGVTVERDAKTLNFVGDWVITRTGPGSVDIARGKILVDQLGAVIVDQTGEVVRSFC